MADSLKIVNLGIYFSDRLEFGLIRCAIKSATELSIALFVTVLIEMLDQKCTNFRPKIHKFPTKIFQIQ